MFEQTILVGNLSKDPEMRYTGSGTPVTRFDIPSDRGYTKEDGTKVENTQWYQISVFGKIAESCAKYLTKGSIVTVVGEVTPNAYIAKDGKPAASLQLRAQTVRFIYTHKNGNVEQIEGKSEGYQKSFSDSTPTEDIPF